MVEINEESQEGDGKTDRTSGKSSGKSPRFKIQKICRRLGNTRITHKLKNQEAAKKTRVSPTCTIVFSALGFQSLEQIPNLENYEQSPIADKSDIVYDRGLKYACQVNTVVKSLLLKSNDILDYELDEEGGVAQTSSIPTFNYFISELSHDIYDRNRHLNIFEILTIGIIAFPMALETNSTTMILDKVIDRIVQNLSFNIIFNNCI